MDLVLRLFFVGNNFQDDEGTLNLHFGAKVDEKSFRCSEWWKFKHLQFHLQLGKLHLLIV